jgi:hypothetical protein
MFALSFLELALFIPVLLVLAWTTTFQYRTGTKWLVVFIGFGLYCIYAKWSAGSWPPMLDRSFWADGSTYWGLTKYLALGVVYALVEMVSNIVEEKGMIRARWNALLEADSDLKSYVTGAVGDEQTKMYSSIHRFCSNWGNHKNFVLLKAHELERTPQPVINFDRVKSVIASWIVLWPAYLVSLFFGRFLDRAVNAINALFRRIGQTVVRVLFRNTFSAN